MNLAERTIRDAQPGPKQRFLWDAQVKGLGVRITPAGSKAYVLDYRIHGRRRRGVLARVSEISLREARCRAGAELARIRAGESNPLTRRQEAREAPTVNDGIDRFFGPESVHARRSFWPNRPWGRNSSTPIRTRNANTSR